MPAAAGTRYMGKNGAGRLGAEAEVIGVMVENRRADEHQPTARLVQIRA